MSGEAGEFVFAPLGGLGEVGMNAALYGFGTAKKRKWILVDCGVAFAHSDMPGVDVRSTLTPGASVGTSDLVVELTPGRGITGSLEVVPATLEEAMARAPVNAMRVVQAVGSQAGLLDRGSLEALLEQAPPDVGVRPLVE